ncbi:MAG: MBL fold metallo-hydrolase [Anaerolineae bacterium]
MAHIELKVGDVHVWLLDCGAFRYDGGVIFGAVPKTSWQVYHLPDSENRISVGLRPLLIRQEDGFLLVNTALPEDDPGLPSDPPGFRPVRQALAEVGISPEEVAAVVLTHLHPDHIGGNLIVDEGQWRPAFPKARYLVQRAEAAAATFPNERTRADYDPTQLEALRQAGVLQLVNGRQRLSKAVQLLPAPGHTPGQQCVYIADGGESALYTTDLAIVPVQAERLTWISALDTHPMQSLESKRELLGRAVEEGTLLLFEHEPDDARCWGRLLPDNKRWRFLPGY